MSEIKHTGAPQQQRLQAAEEAEGRGRLTELRQQLYGAATDQMLEAAHLRPGDHVLDIAAGPGDQSRQAARLVGPVGSVLATDIEQEMLNVAARLAQQEGLSNIMTRAMNAEQLDLVENSYDAVISRLGLMLIPRQHQALTEIRRVLKPGGRVAALVWSKPERKPPLRPVRGHCREIAGGGGGSRAVGGSLLIGGRSAFCKRAHSGRLPRGPGASHSA